MTRLGPLRRTSTGLSPAHFELIKMLARQAVENFLRETETANEEQKETK